MTELSTTPTDVADQQPDAPTRVPVQEVAEAIHGVRIWRGQGEGSFDVLNVGSIDDRSPNPRFDMEIASSGTTQYRVPKVEINVAYPDTTDNSVVLRVHGAWSARRKAINARFGDELVQKAIEALTIHDDTPILLVTNNGAAYRRAVQAKGTPIGDEPTELEVNRRWLYQDYVIEISPDRNAWGRKRWADAPDKNPVREQGFKYHLVAADRSDEVLVEDFVLAGGFSARGLGKYNRFKDSDMGLPHELVDFNLMRDTSRVESIASPSGLDRTYELVEFPDSVQVGPQRVRLIAHTSEIIAAYGRFQATYFRDRDFVLPSTATEAAAAELRAALDAAIPMRKQVDAWRVAAAGDGEVVFPDAVEPTDS